jgi:hypothetical protein
MGVRKDSIDPYSKLFNKSFMGFTSDGFGVFRSTNNMSEVYKKGLQQKLKRKKVLHMDETLIGVYEEKGLEEVLELPSREVYTEVKKFARENNLDYIADVNTKYKTVDRKVRPVATQLPADSDEKIQLAADEPTLQNARNIGHKFTEATLQQLKIGSGEFLSTQEETRFRSMLSKHGKAFAFTSAEIGCVDPTVVSPMVIFTVPHEPWNLKPIPVPRALLPKLIELLKEKVKMGILEPSIGPYSSRWFTVKKKSGALRFIQDMQPVNQVTIRNMGSGPIVDEVAEAFAGRAIYSSGDLFSGYDQFQLAAESRDLTTMKTPLGLMRMCTLPMGATNSVAHMQNAMHKVLREFIPEKTFPFLDDIPIKGCLVEDKMETVDADECRLFVADHIKDVSKILTCLEEVGLTLSAEKSVFGVDQIIVVGHLCGAFGRLPNPAKVDVIARMKDCANITEVRRFLGACIFFVIWIPHYAHISEPLYSLLRKNVRFCWGESQRKAMKHLKLALQNPPLLRPIDYECGRPVVITVDTSPIGIGWALGQDDEEGRRFATRLGARTLSERQRKYPQHKRELWGIVTAMKVEKNYLIGTYVVLETDCLPLISMIASCTTPDIAMLRWIAFIRSLNPELRHIARKENTMADMLSRARYEGEEEMLATDPREVVGIEVNISSVLDEHVEFFREELYGDILRDIGLYLQTCKKQDHWTANRFKKIRRRAYGFLLKDGYLWKQPKRSDSVPLRVIDDSESKESILKEFHDSLWAGHRGVWATYIKIKERYWWKGLYKDAAEFVSTCKECQL